MTFEGDPDHRSTPVFLEDTVLASELVGAYRIHPDNLMPGRWRVPICEDGRIPKMSDGRWLFHDRKVVKELALQVVTGSGGRKGIVVDLATLEDLFDFDVFDPV